MSFQDKFPSLKDLVLKSNHDIPIYREFDVVKCIDIDKYCLDRQKVWKAFKNRVEQITLHCKDEILVHNQVILLQDLSNELKIEGEYENTIC
jgi:hypothetical protein